MPAAPVVRPGRETEAAKKFAVTFARTGTRLSRDTIGCDDDCGAGQVHRSVRLAEFKTELQSGIVSAADVAGRHSAAGAPTPG